MIVVPKRWSWLRDRVKARRSALTKELLQEDLYIYTVFAFSACASQGKSFFKKTLHIGEKRDRIVIYRHRFDPEESL